MPEALIIVFLVLTGALLQRPPDNALVLMPDEDGTVGRVVFTRGGDSVTIDTAGSGLDLDGRVAADRVRRFSDREIRTLFADALAVTPPAPRSYLLYFETGQSGLDDAARATLSAILRDIDGRPAPRVAVIGHTDRVGAAAVNVRLARDRAVVIRDALAAGGVPEAIISLRSHGEGDPLVATPDGVAEPRNRRAEVMVR